jgi:AbrB family looped-hinge helix DNA binding protein
MTKPVVEIVRVGKRGEIIVPRRIRNALQLQEGEELVMSIAEQRLVIERRARNFATYLDVMGNGSKGEE